MRHDFPDKAVIDQELRILMRSRHIYILFAGLIHLGLGMYFMWCTRRLARVFQVVGSALLLASGVLLVWAFVSETYYLHRFSESSRQGIYAALTGVLVHVIAALADRTDRSKAGTADS